MEEFRCCGCTWSIQMLNLSECLQKSGTRRCRTWLVKYRASFRFTAWYSCLISFLLLFILRGSISSSTAVNTISRKPTMSFTTTHNDLNSAPGVFAASKLNNEANALSMSGNHAAAEKKHLEALELKIRATGQNSIGVALTKNALGELYLKIGKLDEAAKMLEDADQIRNGELIFWVFSISPSFWGFGNERISWLWINWY